MSSNTYTSSAITHYNLPPIMEESCSINNILNKHSSTFTSYLLYNSNRGKDPLGNNLLVSSESNVLGVLDSKPKSKSEFFYHIWKHFWLEAK